MVPLRVPWACLPEEPAVPQAHSTGGIKLLPAELGEEGEQPEQDAELGHGLETKGHSPCLPRDRLRDPRGGGGSSKHSSPRLPGGAGLSTGVCAARGTMGQPGLGASGVGLPPELGWGACATPAAVREAIPSSAEPHTQPGSPSPPPQPGALIPPPLAPAASRKRQLCSPQSSQGGKRPRLGLSFGLSPLGEQMELVVGGGLWAQGAGQVSEPLGTELSSSSPALALCLCESPGAPVSQPGAVAAGLGPAGSTGWGKDRPQGRQHSTGDSDSTARSGDRPGVGSTESRSSCPAGCLPSPTLPGAAGRCCCSLRVRAAAETAPGAPHGPRQGAQSPDPLPPAAQSPEAAQASSRSSWGSQWDVQVLPRPRGAQGCRTVPGHRDLLQQPQPRGRDSGYQSQLCSVLGDPELPWAAQGDKSCRNCCTDTTGASFPILGTLFGS